MKNKTISVRLSSHLCCFKTFFCLYFELQPNPAKPDKPTALKDFKALRTLSLSPSAHTSEMRVTLSFWIQGKFIQQHSSIKKNTLPNSGVKLDFADDINNVICQMGCCHSKFLTTWRKLLDKLILPGLCSEISTICLSYILHWTFSGVLWEMSLVCLVQLPES